MAGLIADWVGMHWAIGVVAVITALSGLVAARTLEKER